VRKIALALPEVERATSHGALCFFIQDRRPLCYYHDNHPWRRPAVSVWCAVTTWCSGRNGCRRTRAILQATDGAQRGTFENWLGVFLDTPELDWREIAAVIEEAFRRAAPKKACLPNSDER